ncbi:MAG: recombinase family protein [Chitinispirillales bacterium]|jgi:DNA invertase Pin-like site-specific DNA recombinase|nr:recombinase family protein [Chitinispirillales bacterium]
MIYGYIRVSTDKQTVENQRYEINSILGFRVVFDCEDSNENEKREVE